MLGVIALIAMAVGVLTLIIGLIMDYGGPRFVGGVILVFFGLVFASQVVTFVDEGEVHVPIRFGEALEPITAPGPQAKSPFASVIAMPIRTVEVTFEGAGVAGEDETSANLREINALSAEGAQVGVDITVLYHIDPTMAKHVYATVGTA